MQEVRIEFLQRMPIFGGIRADTLQFLLACCPIVSVPTNEFFFREHEQRNSMFVLELGKCEEVLLLGLRDAGAARCPHRRRFDF